MKKTANIVKRFGCACSGVKASWQTEWSFRAHIGALGIVVLVLLITNPAPVWWALLLLTSGTVIATELINTAIEKLIDHIHPGQHPTIKIVKDTLAGAVLIESIVAAGIFIAFITAWMS